jgi:hypothetical protein
VLLILTQDDHVLLALHNGRNGTVPILTIVGATRAPFVTLASVKSLVAVLVARAGLTYLAADPARGDQRRGSG